jgi:hypothetical protein
MTKTRDLADLGGGFIQAGTGAVQRTVESKLQDVVSVLEFIPTNLHASIKDGSATTDCRTYIEAAINAVAVNGGTLFFPRGTYPINRYIACIASNISIIGDTGALIRQQSTSTGYIADGLRVGNPNPGDGGTNNIGSPTFVQNIYVSNLRFEGCRISVWCVYAKNVTVENIWADGVSAVATGNDADCQCYNVVIKNINHLGWATGNEAPFYAVGIYQTFGFTVDSINCAVGMPTSTNAAYMQVENSQFGSVSNVHIDGVNNNGNGLTVAACQYIQISNISIVRTKNGFITFAGTAGFSTNSTVSNCSIINCTTGIRVYTLDTTFNNIIVQGGTTSLAIMTDGQRNTFNNCIFNADGSGTLYEEAPGSQSLQRWRGCVGIRESYSADGTLAKPAICGQSYTSTGLFFPSPNNLAFSAGGTETVRFNSYGLLFNGDTAQANALNDYEKGSWTPTLTGSTGGAYTYNYRTGIYTKIGDIVTVHCSFEITGTTTPYSGSLIVSGLPFTCRDVRAVGSMIPGSAITYAAPYTFVFPQVELNSAFFYIAAGNLNSIVNTGATVSNGIMYGFSLQYTTS